MNGEKSLDTSLMKADSFGIFFSMFNEHFAIGPWLNLSVVVCDQWLLMMGLRQNLIKVNMHSQLHRDAHENGEVCSSRQHAVAAAFFSRNRKTSGGSVSKEASEMSIM